MVNSGRTLNTSCEGNWYCRSCTSSKYGLLCTMNVPGLGRGCSGGDLADWFGADAIQEHNSITKIIQSSDTLEEEASDEQHDDPSNEEDGQEADTSDHEQGPR